MNIVKISELNNVMIINHENNMVFGNQKLLKVEFENGKIRYLDTQSKRDITTLSYLEIIDKLSTEKIIFEDEISW